MSAYKPMAVHLETERLSMQPWAEPDAGELCALVCERGSRTTVERCREAIASGLAKTAVTGLAVLPIRRRDEGDFIGYCGLIVGRSTAEEPEIAYELLRRAHGRGYATEAAHAMLRLGFEGLGLHRIVARVDERNEPSVKLARRLGMRQEARLVHNEFFKGEWSTEVDFAMLAGEWYRLARR